MACAIIEFASKLMCKRTRQYLRNWLVVMVCEGDYKINYKTTANQLKDSTNDVLNNLLLCNIWT